MIHMYLPARESRAGHRDAPRWGIPFIRREIDTLSCLLLPVSARLSFPLSHLPGALLPSLLSPLSVLFFPLILLLLLLPLSTILPFSHPLYNIHPENIML